METRIWRKEKSGIINLPNISKLLFRGKKGASSRKAFTQHQPDGFSVFAKWFESESERFTSIFAFFCACVLSNGEEEYTHRSIQRNSKGRPLRVKFIVEKKMFSIPVWFAEVLSLFNLVFDSGLTQSFQGNDRSFRRLPQKDKFFLVSSLPATMPAFQKTPKGTTHKKETHTTSTHRTFSLRVNNFLFCYHLPRKFCSELGLPKGLLEDFPI